MKPVDVLQRKADETLQVLAVFHLFIMFFLGPILASLFCIYILFFTQFYFIVVAYIIWIFIDQQTPYKDGRRSKWVRNMKLWKYFVKYFPQRLVKTADLPPISNYIFCTFPHGIMCSGAFAQFAFDTSDFAKQYPGLTITCHTLNTNFYIPFSRDYALSLGLTSVSKEALLYQLNKPCGRAVNLVVGGSAEAMKSKPGTYRVVLKNRKGFIKLALITGTPLVPIYIFGEVDLYDQNIFPESSFVYKCQQAVRKLTGVAPCWFRGEGLFGILPKRVPVTTVIGRPIPVQKTLNPTSEEIDKLHKIFIRDLVALFDEYKYQYIANPDTSFLSVED